MKKILILCVVAVGLVLAGCGPKQIEKQHSTTGVIKSIDQDQLQVVIDHASFADGFMDAMTMPYHALNRDLLTGLKADDRIRFTVSENNKGYTVTKIEKLP